MTPDPQSHLCRAAGSNPGETFYFFSNFAQTLRACICSAQKIAKMGPFAFKSRASGLPLHAFKVRGVSRRLCES